MTRERLSIETKGFFKLCLKMILKVLKIYYPKWKWKIYHPKWKWKICHPKWKWKIYPLRGIYE